VSQSSLDQRYTFNAGGTLYFSALKAAGAWPNLEAACMTHIANLRPLCGRCNSSRGNPLKYPMQQGTLVGL